jgi:hypothetical protein
MDVIQKGWRQVTKEVLVVAGTAGGSFLLFVMISRILF